VGGPGKATPASGAAAPRDAAGVTKRLWEMGDIVDVLEAWERSQNERSAA
jgi:hypothetical protein